MSDLGLPHKNPPHSPLTRPAEVPAAALSQPLWKRALAGIVPFAAQKAAFGVVVILAIIYLTYLGLDMADGAELGVALREALPDTVEYVSHALQGDLGETSAGSDNLLTLPVKEVLSERFARSMGLMGISLGLASVVGILLGISAARSKSKRSLGIILTTIIGVSVPSFFAAFLLQWAATTYTRVVGQSLVPVGGFGWDSHLILPVLVLAARPVAQITRITFVSVRGAQDEDYVRTARGKGLHRHRVMYIHVMRNATIPVLATIGISLGFILSSLPVVELYFGWPGIGFTLLKSIAQHDDNLTIALVVVLGVVFLLVNFLLEVSYRFVDPRLLETQSHIGSSGSRRPLESLRHFGQDARAVLRKLIPLRRLQNRKSSEMPGALSTEIVASGDETSIDIDPGVRRRSAIRAVLGNFPLIAGGLLVAAIVLLVFAGPALAPHSPYQNQALRFTEGQLTTPPFPPSPESPWGTDLLGRDLQSLILSGLQQTIILVFLAVAARVVVGVVLGAIAGWRSGTTSDRFIQGVADILAAYPTLLLTMIFILAFGIRKGMSTFVLAMCLVGWGEIMRYVRSEVISIRPKPYIESAIAVGSQSSRILSRHIIPNLFSGLVSVIALETGSVLMLLGELGFIGIFIGGGMTMLTAFGSVHYSDVPEWGALLTNLRFQVRSYPWTGLYPMAAFFLAILSFNLFSEGLRRLADEGYLIIGRLVNRYTIVAAVAILVAAGWLQSNSGSLPFYRQSAEGFEAENAISHLDRLASPEMQGRAIGSAGLDLAADYIAGQFQAFGLQPAGQAITFFQERSRAFEYLEAAPRLSIDDGGPPLVFGEDFAAYPGRYMTDGQAAGPTRVVLLGEPIASSPGSFRSAYAELERADFSDEVVLTLSDREARALTGSPMAGMLVVPDDPGQLEKRYTLPGRSGLNLNFFTGERTGEETPSLWIGEDPAARLLEGSGYRLEDLKAQAEDLSPGEVFELPLARRVDMQVDGALEESWPVRNVIGYIPGTHSFDNCFDCLARQLIVVMAQYDAPPLGVDGAYPGANDNASAVAVMLEAIRLLQESEYDPYKTILFIAYSGEGLDGGEVVSDPDIKGFLQAKVGFATELTPEAVIKIRGLGGGSGDRLEISAAGSLRLAELLEKAAGQIGVGVVRANDPIDISVIYEDEPVRGGQEAPEVRMYWEGWEETSRTPEDSLNRISAENIEDAGRTLALALMILGREINY